MENYRTITKMSELQAYLAMQPVVAFDFETAPDEQYRNEAKAALDPRKAHITGVSFLFPRAAQSMFPWRIRTEKISEMQMHYGCGSRKKYMKISRS